MKATKKPKRVKPDKPYDGFPLTPHPSGRWCKKVKGKLHYFGPWEDSQAALNEWLKQRDDLMAGIEPSDAKGKATIRDVVNAFLTSKEDRQKAGELTQRTFQDYHATCGRLLDCFGRTMAAAALSQPHFQRYARTIAEWAPVTRSNEIQRVRTVFKYGFDAGLLETPLRFGPDFKRPSKQTIARDRQEKPDRLFERKEIRTLLKKASIQLRAMILLGINCGFGNTDISGLNWVEVNLKAGIVAHARQKTTVERRAPLWRETVTALKALQRWSKETLTTGEGRGQRRYRPADPADADAVFLTKQQQRFVRHDKSIRDSVGLAFGKLLRAAGIKRMGVGFYSLRHTFETRAMGSLDQGGVDHIMGHTDQHMRSTYQHWSAAEDRRLRKVTEHVRGWLYGK